MSRRAQRPADADMHTTVLNVVDLHKEFRVKRGGRARTLVAVDSVSVDVHPGETVALVGESGSGKSTVARCIARLVEPTGGSVMVNGHDMSRLTPTGLARAYGDLQMVFQDPNSSLNPRRSIMRALDEPLRLHTMLDRHQRRQRCVELVEMVGLTADHLERYPSELSGGQRQRVGIARALAVSPRVVLLDEPTASLDVSVRGQILDLLMDLQRSQRLGYLFISHDLEVVRRVSDRVMVMYLGSIVESGTTEEVFENPTHPYTKALLSAAPHVEPGRRRDRFRLEGEIPSPFNLGEGCRLAGRCPLAQSSCVARRPEPMEVSPTHLVACPVVLENEVDHTYPRTSGTPRKVPA